MRTLPDSNSPADLLLPALTQAQERELRQVPEPRPRAASHPAHFVAIAAPSCGTKRRAVNVAWAWRPAPCSP